MLLDHFPKFNIAFGVVVLICFFLPWVSIDCGETTIVELSGYDLTIGHVVLEQDAANKLSAELARSGGSSEPLEGEHHISPQFYLLVVALCSLGIIGYSVRMREEVNRVGMVAVGIFGVFGILLMTFAAARDFGLDLPADAARMVHISHPIAFYVIILAFSASVALSVLAMRGTSEDSKARVNLDLPIAKPSGLPEVAEDLHAEIPVNPGGPTNAFGEPVANSGTPAAGGTAAAPSRICHSCGAELAETQLTCPKCGRSTTPGT